MAVETSGGSGVVGSGSSGSGELLALAKGGVLRLTLNRPERRNALSAPLLEQLVARLDEADRDASVRIVVITGAGEKAFSAGGDLQGAPAGGFLALHDGRGLYARALLRLEEMGKPVVARVNGAALGGGLGLALACDLAVAADTATFGTPEIDVGLFPMMVLAILTRHVGRKRALEMAFTGEKLSAADALAAGLVNRVVEAKALDAATDELAAKLAAKSPAVLRLGRQAFHATQDMSYGDALRYLHAQLTVNTLTEDAAEGVTAFVTKRKPEWKGR